MIVRMPSNPRITRAGQKSSAHIFLRDRQDIRDLCEVIAAPKFYSRDLLP